jgi:hypothetical protein
MEPVRIKSVALPVEHGGWGMLGEPLLLGLLVAPSWAGVGIGLAALFAFLTRHPLKLALADRPQGRRNARTIAAERFALLYATLALAALVPSARGAAGWWLPLVLAAPLGLVQLTLDARHQGRALLPELMGGVALGSVAAAEIRAAGWSLAVALAAWAVMAVKAAAAILYVRARLRCDRGLPFGRTAVVAVHVAAIGGAVVLAALGGAPWLAAAAFVLLLARALHGLSRFHRRVRPRSLGFMEMGYGIAFVAFTVLGYVLGC